MGENDLPKFIWDYLGSLGFTWFHLCFVGILDLRFGDFCTLLNGWIFFYFFSIFGD